MPILFEEEKRRVFFCFCEFEKALENEFGTTPTIEGQKV